MTAAAGDRLAPGSHHALDAYAGTPVLVLGATGFIGRWVVRALAARGADLSVAVRDTRRAEDDLAADRAQARVLPADLSRPGAVSAAVRESRPAIVFNLAGYGVDPAERDSRMMASVNAALVAELCAQLASDPAHGWRGLRLVHAGSALEYGAVGGVLSEDVAPRPTTDYGRTKLEATQHVERLARSTGLRAATARLFTVYGPGEGAGRLLPSLVDTARTGVRLQLTEGLQRRDFTYVEDVAEGLLRLGVSSAAPGAVINVATGTLTSVREFVETAASVLPIARSSLAFGALPARADEMWHDAVDVRRLRNLTSWVPSISVIEGIRRAREWEHARP